MRRRRRRRAAGRSSRRAARPCPAPGCRTGRCRTPTPRSRRRGPAPGRARPARVVIARRHPGDRHRLLGDADRLVGGQEATPEAKPHAPPWTTRTAKPRSSTSLAPWRAPSRTAGAGSGPARSGSRRASRPAPRPAASAASAEVAVGEREEARIDTLAHGPEPSGRGGHAGAPSTRRVEPCRCLAHDQLRRDPVAHLGDVADHADDPAAVAQRVEGVHHVVEGVGVQRAEALVDEQGVEVGAAGLLGDDVGQSERQRERDHERLAAGQRRRVAGLAGPVVAHQQAQPAARSRRRPARPVCSRE